jgi:flagellar basal-body rod protein FlgF
MERFHKGDNLINALSAVAQSMQNDLQQMNTISQNMVNMATPGYKRSVSVGQAFGAALQAAGPEGASTSITGTIPALNSVLDMSSGPVKQTGKPWDVAITGDGYFELSSPEGLVYTRAGNFRLDGTGRLVSESGFPVQGLNGEIILNGTGATIDRSGQIHQDGVEVAQLKVVRFQNPKAMIKSGSGMLQPGTAGNTPVEISADLELGYLESSNVTPLREMVTMMQTTRHFESTQKLFQGYDEALRTAIQKLGEF